MGSMNKHEDAHINMVFTYRFGRVGRPMVCARVHAVIEWARNALAVDVHAQYPRARHAIKTPIPNRTYYS